MLTPGPNTNTSRPHDYGAANKFGFDDPNKWYTQPDIPLLDEHEMTSDNGQPIAAVDRSVLEEIARNNNRKVYETGDPATLILGHTSDDPAAPEKPAKGFVVNYRVKPFKRDDNGRVLYAIYGDYKIRPQNKHLIDEYPRRSVELWWHRKDIDPIAMLGGSSPERDLGAVIRHGRINHVSMNTTPGAGSSVRGSTTNSQEEVIKFSTRGARVIETYSIDDPRYARRSNSRGSRMATPNRYAADCGPNGKMRYGDDLMNTNDPSDGGDYDPGDDGTPDDDMDAAPDNSFDAQLGQSKVIKQLQDGIQQILETLQGGGGGMGGPPGPEMGGPGGDMGEPMGGEMPPPGAGAPPGMGGGGPMDAPGGDPGMDGGTPPPGDDQDQDGVPDEEESRRGMGERPVQMSETGATTGMPGPMNTFVPNTQGKRKVPYSRNGHTMNGTQQRNGRAVQTGRPAAPTTPGRNPQQDEEMRELRLRLARSDAEKLVAELETKEGVLFGVTPEQHAQGRQEEVDELTEEFLYDQDEELKCKRYGRSAPKTDETLVGRHVRTILNRYSRRRPDPAVKSPGAASLSRYTRTQVDITGQQPAGEDIEAFEASLTDQETVQYAELQARRNMKPEDAMKFMRNRQRQGR